MYTGAHFKVTDPTLIEEFLRTYSFATLINVVDNTPLVTHIPLELEVDNAQKMTLTGHMAKANPQWKSFKDGGKVVVLFRGPHTYVTSRWYDHVNVPTWNYIAVNLHGSIRLITEQEELMPMMETLMKKYESGPQALTMKSFPPDYLNKEMRGLVAFKITVNSVDANFKLSQNRHDADYLNIIHELEKRPDDDSRAVAHWMRKLRLHLER